mmetsp:Transcript_51773/g.103947  ORF Transcript_51773/g.103947 Transcript_51773/m.103947 type:complete len:208 (+) Transcript_51773:645-1268(+)
MDAADKPNWVAASCAKKASKVEAPKLKSIDTTHTEATPDHNAEPNGQATTSSTSFSSLRLVSPPPSCCEATPPAAGTVAGAAATSVDEEGDGGGGGGGDGDGEEGGRRATNRATQRAARADPAAAQPITSARGDAVSADLTAALATAPRDTSDDVATLTATLRECPLESEKSTPPSAGPTMKANVAAASLHAMYVGSRPALAPMSAR